MPRATNAPQRNQKKKAYFQRAKGNYGARRTQWKRVKQASIKAGQHQYRHRRERKREMRRLWITRITAAARQRGLSYSRFMGGLKTRDVALNRKMLSEIAIRDPEAFDKLAEASTEGMTELERERAAA